MGKKVLFIAPPYMGLYKDIIEEMEKQGYDVTYIKEVVRPEDPDNIRGYKGLKKFFLVNRNRFTKKNETYWNDILNTRAKDAYDILFVLNGQSLSPCIFKILKERNPQLYCTNYMFDTTKGIYRFDKNFKYFDKIASFDREESEKYGINLLPIYWKPSPLREIKYKFFGMGAFKKDRFQLFKAVSDFAMINGYDSFIKLYVLKITCVKLKSQIRKFLNIQQAKVNKEEYYSDLATHVIMPLSQFNELLDSSEIIIDTNAPHQDGLTSRFMQALGNEKKIITTNSSAEKYDFYTSEQIYVVKNIDEILSKERFSSFVKAPLKLSDSIRDAISVARIDNWIKFLLEE